MRILRLFPILVFAGCQTDIGAGGKAVDVSGAVRDGAYFLLKSQNKDGSWGTGTKGSGFEPPLPLAAHHAYRVATTALCVMALRKVGGGKDLMDAHRRGVEFLITSADNADLRRLDGRTLVNVWAHIYAIQALCSECVLGPRDARIEAAAKRHLDLLQRCETMYGGWTYEDDYVGAQRPAVGASICVTAAALIALEDARLAEMPIPKPVVDRAVSMLLRCRKPDGSYAHHFDIGYEPLSVDNRDRGGLAREQAANYTLWQHAQRIPRDDVRAGLQRFFREHKFLDSARKRPSKHAAWYVPGGHYYYWGHYYAARIISELRPEDREIFSPQTALAMRFQERDGSWWDEPLYDYHRPCDTALAVLTLVLIRPR